MDGAEGEMVQRVELLAAKPDYQSSIPGTHTVEGESRFQQIILWPPPVYHDLCSYTYTQTNVQTR